MTTKKQKQNAAAELLLNVRYTAIRARANELLDNARFEDQDWQNEQFELNVEYNAICDQLKQLGYTGIENFPGN